MDSLINETLFLIASSSALLLPVAHADFITNSATQAVVDQATTQNTSLTDLALSIANKKGIKPSTLENLINSESSWNPNAKGDHGCSYGLAQINICAHPEIDKEDALDPIFAMTFAAKAIANDTDSMFSSCNCYSFVQANYIKNLPHMADIQPNATPKPGNVAIFYYTDKETGGTVKHIAYIKSVSNGQITISEANKIRCLVDQRTIPTNDPFLAGFWSPYAA